MSPVCSKSALVLFRLPDLSSSSKVVHFIIIAELFSFRENKWSKKGSLVNTSCKSWCQSGRHRPPETFSQISSGVSVPEVGPLSALASSVCHWQTLEHLQMAPVKSSKRRPGAGRWTWQLLQSTAVWSLAAAYMCVHPLPLFRPVRKSAE